MTVSPVISNRALMAIRTPVGRPALQRPASVFAYLSARQKQAQTAEPALPLRQAPLRYLGYTSELGESLRGVIPAGLVRGSYLLTLAYIAADITQAVLKARDKAPARAAQTGQDRQTAMVLAGVDAAIFQGTASLLLPSGIIWSSKTLLKRLLKPTGLSPALKRRLPIGLGLGLIPTIVRPVDHLVEDWMTRHVRPKLQPKP